MAKSINERAYDYAIEEAQVEGFDFGSVKDGYIQGATEQKQIDDEEYRKDMRYINIKKQELIDKACNNVELLLSAIKTNDNKEALLEEFRKAMEE